MKFQCRTQHCVCRDVTEVQLYVDLHVSMPHAALCVSGQKRSSQITSTAIVSMPHAALCVSGQSVNKSKLGLDGVSMPHAALCVSGPSSPKSRKKSTDCFNAARSIVCVGTLPCCLLFRLSLAFQCRTQHCVCRDTFSIGTSPRSVWFQCRTQHCVCRDEVVDLFGGESDSFNAARSIVCVGTPRPAALVPRGLRRHFGKTRFFAPFLASADELCPEKWGSHRRCSLCGAGCTVLERRNGGMRLCARAGALSISFSSYLMIAHASFFFNDVFASMQRGL